MIVSPLLLLQNVVCNDKTGKHGLSSFTVAQRICKKLYGDSVIPLKTTKRSNRIIFVNKETPLEKIDIKPPDEIDWREILADAARQLREQRRRRGGAATEDLRIEDVFLGNVRNTDIRFDVNQIVDPIPAPIPGPTVTGTIEDAPRRRTGRAIRGFTYRGNGEWETPFVRAPGTTARVTTAG